MNAEQIRDEYLAKAREAARMEGRDVEVTSLALDQACARIAELEGALADTQALEMNHEGAVVRLMREKETQAAELERLRTDLAYSKACAVEGSAATLGELDRLRACVEAIRNSLSKSSTAEDFVTDVAATLASLNRAVSAQAEPRAEFHAIGNPPPEVMAVVQREYKRMVADKDGGK